MPNSANKGNGKSNSGQGQRHHPSEQHEQEQEKPNPERSDIKQGTAGNDSHTHRSSNQGRKEASGGRIDGQE